MKKLLYIACLIGLLSSCLGNRQKETIKKTNDFTVIQDSGVINVITLYSSISYFIYKGEPMGYEYELLKDFADSHGLKINIKIAANTNMLTEMLLRGEGDLVAYNIPVTNEMKQLITYCGREVITQQVLIQRANRKDTLLRDVTDLIGKEVWVKHNTKYYDRLINLNNELGGGIIIRDIQKDTINTEDLIELVSEGKIPYTVGDNNIAQLNKTYYSNIDISLILSHPQRSSWAVRKDSPILADTLNKWFEENKNTTKYKAIMKRYFEMSKSPGNEPVSELGKLYAKDKVSPFDDIFKKYTAGTNIDWRLMASISYQESRFDTTGVSWAGAVGLMGLMPGTATAMGITPDERTDPDASVKAAVQYIHTVARSYKSIPDEDDRIRFILAAYNAGLGHVLDAQALATKYGKNPKVWNDNVEEYIRLKSVPEYYNDSVCKHGYLRGSETAAYVRDVMRRWRYYQEKVH